MANWTGVKVSLTGYAPRDAELRYTKKGDRRILTFSIGIDAVDPAGPTKRYVNVTVLEDSGLDMDDLAENVKVGTNWNVKGVAKARGWIDEKVYPPVGRANLEVYAMQMQQIAAPGSDSEEPPPPDDDDYETTATAAATGHTPYKSQDMPF